MRCSPTTTCRAAAVPARSSSPRPGASCAAIARRSRSSRGRRAASASPSPSPTPRSSATRRARSSPRPAGRLGRTAWSRRRRLRLQARRLESQGRRGRWFRAAPRGATHAAAYKDDRSGRRQATRPGRRSDGATMARRRLGKLITSAIWIVIGGGLIAGAGFLAMRPADVDSCVARAVAAVDAGRIDVALHEYDEALAQLPRERGDLRPRRAQLLRERGDLHLVLRRPKHALDDYEAAQTLAASDWVAWDRVGRAYLALEKFSEAALQFE